MADEVKIEPTPEAIAEAKAVLTPATEPTPQAVETAAKVLLEAPLPTAEAVATAKDLLEPPVPTAEEIAKAKDILKSVGQLPPADQRVLSTTWDYTAWASLITGRAIACAYRILNGLKTFLFFGITGACALLDSFAGVDFSGILGKFLPEGSKLSSTDVIVLMSVIGILLRLVSNGPVFQRMRGKQSLGDGQAPGVGTGSVDEPR